MRKSIGCAVATCLLLAGVVAGEGVAKGRRYEVQRTEREGYVGSRGGSGSSPEVYLDEVVFETQRHERLVSIAVDDRTGQPVAASVLQDGETVADVCGSTPEPVAIQGGTPVMVKVRPGPCTDGTPAVMTSGGVEATFTGYVKKAPAAPDLGCMTKQPAPRRDVTETYLSPGGFAGVDGHPYLFVHNEISETETFGGVATSSWCGETTVEVAVKDASGQPARAVVMQSPPSQPTAEEHVGDVCGATSEPLEIRPGSRIVVFMVAGPCADGTPAAATTGTVALTFSGS